MNEQSNQAIAQKVSWYLKDCHPDGVTLEVVESGIRREDSMWYVPVRPDVEPRKRYEHYEALADIENDLEDKEQVKVLLVPSAPKVEQAA